MFENRIGKNKETSTCQLSERSISLELYCFSCVVSSACTLSHNRCVHLIFMCLIFLQGLDFENQVHRIRYMKK